MWTPKIIQGGMGVGVSGWQLARSVSQLGQLGVVSGTAMDVVLARRLQLGDADGHLRRAAATFPFPDVVREVWDAYFIPGGKAADAPFRTLPLQSIQPPRILTRLTVLANFIEVTLAKEGHNGKVGINFLEKIQLPTLPAMYGALLAGVDYVLMGAGIPRAIPGILDRLSRGEPVELKLDAKGMTPGQEVTASFEPQSFCGGPAPELKRPQFIGIVASATLAITLARKSSGRVDGFVVEGETAGGHNAPPRGPLQLTEKGEPLYGPRDTPELNKIRDLGLPFWLAGSYAHPDKLAAAEVQGAAGIQVGTAFAFCEESGIAADIKKEVIRQSVSKQTSVFTDPLASPTGFPFKVVQLEGTMSDQALYETRKRKCDLGYLRETYIKADGSPGYRCPGEPVEDFVKKGGTVAEAVGKKCICNGLLATVDLAQQHRDRGAELALVTAGNDVSEIAQFLKTGHESYTASDVVEYILRDVPCL